MTREISPPLGHRVRRCLIRFLHSDFEAHTTDELAAGLDLGADAVRYHCKVLSEWGKVKEYEGPAGLLVESLVAEDPEVLSVLHATEAEDRAA